MDPKLAESISLLRHAIISPVLMDSTAAQLAYFKQIASREFEVPGRGLRRFTPGTMKGWLYRFRKYGLPGITPRTRSDAGGFRTISSEQSLKIRTHREENLELSCVKFYDLCVREKILGAKPVCMETLRRFLKQEGLYQARTTIPRKRFEMARFGELWTGDFMHGPEVLLAAGDKKTRRSILLAIIDDHSRLIVAQRWGATEDTKLIELVFKDALLAHGLPDRLYCDNGASFSSTYLSRACANLQVGLVHSKPYDSPSRGKIERFFRTVRQNFLPDIPKGEVWDLARLNTAFAAWVRDHYHHGPHRGIGGVRPIDRHQRSVREYPRKRVTEEQIDEFFLVSCLRLVNRDCTFSLHTVYYEVPPQFIGRRVEIKYAQDAPSDVYLYENGMRVIKCQPVDSIRNGKSFYAPSPRISDVALHQAHRRSSSSKGENV